MKNIFAVVGFIVVATKGYELYREYSEMKRGRRRPVQCDACRVMAESYLSG
ncbi:hypothetical protein [Pseudomonas putida]